MTWVSPQRLSGRWQPEMFRAEYLALDRDLTETGNYIRLGDVVDIADDSEQVINAKWYIDRSGIRRGVDSEISSDLKSNATRVPTEAILVSKSWVDYPEVRYWNSQIFHGDATAHWNYWVIRMRTGDRCGWLFRELQSAQSELQLQRTANGSVTSWLQSADLLDLRIKNLDASSRQVVNDSVEMQFRSEATSLLSRKLSKPFYLTGRTFEERLRQFETFLETEALFSARDAFFVEPGTNNPNSDFFKVRPILSLERRVAKFVPQEMPDASQAWRNWFWDRERSDRYKLFNSILTESELPTELLACLVHFPSDLANVNHTVLLPAFSTFRDTVAPVLKSETGAEDQEWFDVWTDLQPPIQSRSSSDGLVARNPPEHAEALFNWARLAYRPVLCIKVVREKSTVGAYLLVGRDQLADPVTTYSELDDLGIILSDVLYPPSVLIDEAANRESLRRLSTIMHQVKGPVGRILSALSEVREFFDKHPELGELCLLGEEAAKRFAQLPGARLSGITVAGRLEIAKKAAEEVKRVSDQLIQLRLVQTQTDNRELICLSALVRELGQSFGDAHSDIEVRFVELDESNVYCDKLQLRYAIEEILNNSARELRYRNVEAPRIDISCSRQQNDAWLAIADNGLPIDIPLIDQPFQECVSTYDSLDLGTGLGLAIVRETFLAHGGGCSLQSNADVDEGDRLPGVTFYGHLKVHDLLQRTLS